MNASWLVLKSYSVFRLLAFTRGKLGQLRSLVGNPLQFLEQDLRSGPHNF